MINIKEIQGSYPKAYSELKKWTTKKLMEIQKHFIRNTFDLPEVKVTDKIIEGVLFWNLRQLYDFFDNEEVVISISENADNSFSFYINSSKISNTFDNRLSCEDAAFYDAISILENSLKK